ncbi:MAG: ribosome maturation factor RimM [Bacillota bacterium]|nr:ribosome maturation factor RimM [Bacillota bacterium]
MEKIKIGKIVNAAGIKGEVKVYNYSDDIEAYLYTDTLLLEDTPFKVESVRRQKNMIILKLEGIDDRNGAEAVKGRELFIMERDLPALPEGQFYVRDVLGMTVREEDGAVLGTISDVIQNTAQTLLEVEREDGKKVLIPKVDAFVLDIDDPKRQVTVRLIEGMLDL